MRADPGEVEALVQQRELRGQLVEEAVERVAVDQRRVAVGDGRDADEGLGACFFGIPAEHTAAFRAAFDVPDDHEPVGAIAVGHRLPDAGAAGSPARRERRTNLVHRGRWGTTVGA